MKILVAHNFYQLPGGEDTVFRNETKLLAKHGHQVIEYVRHNRDIANGSLWNYATLPGRVIWNWDSYSDVKALIAEHKPDVAHFHNLFPLISPAAYTACWEAKVPIVQSLHNSRLICPSGGLYYNGRYCQDCLGKSFAWPGVARACYRKSHIQTGLVAIMTAAHRYLGTWNDMVSRYVVFCPFFYNKFVEAGLPPEKLTIKPHFVEDPGAATVSNDYALYAGRLTESKGVATLIDAWKMLDRRVPLKICGEGELAPMIKKFASETNRAVELLPFVPREKVFELMRGASFLVWPSEACESFGLVVLEAFACGVPVIASKLGGMPDLVGNHYTGLTFEPGDSRDLASKIVWAVEHLAEMRKMGQAARSEYEAHYTEAQNLGLLMQIYSDAARHRNG